MGRDFGRYLYRPRAGSGAAHHWLDHANGCGLLYSLCLFWTRVAAALDTPRLRCLTAGRPFVYHAGRYFRRANRRIRHTDHYVHDLRRHPAALGRWQVFYRFLPRRDGRQTVECGPGGGGVIVSARWSVRLRCRYDGDDRHGSVSNVSQGRFREKRRRRIAGGRWTWRHYLTACTWGSGLPDRRISEDQLPRCDLDGDHPDLSLLPFAAVHGRARLSAFRRS